MSVVPSHAMSKPARKAAAPSALAAQTKRALADLRALLDQLPLDGAMSARDEKAAQAAFRVPLDAIAVTERVLRDCPEHYPALDASAIDGTIAYLEAMSAVARALRDAAGRVERSMVKRRKTGADATLILYATMKGVARLGRDGALEQDIARLRDLLTTYRRPKSERVTKKEVRAEAAKAKAAKRARGALDEVAKAKEASRLAEARAALVRSKRRA